MKQWFGWLAVAGVVALGGAGCAGYQRGSAVPTALRTVHVPAFENRTEYPMVGAVAAQQFMDAVIEDGTFRLLPYEQARLRMQVIISHITSSSVRYDRNNAIIPSEFHLRLEAKVYISDRITGDIYVNGQTISATESMLTREDFQTGLTDALPRLSRVLGQRLLEVLQSVRQPDPIQSPEAIGLHIIEDEALPAEAEAPAVEVAPADEGVPVEALTEAAGVAPAMDEAAEEALPPEAEAPAIIEAEPKILELADLEAEAADVADEPVLEAAEAAPAMEAAPVAAPIEAPAVEAEPAIEAPVEAPIEAPIEAPAVDDADEEALPPEAEAPAIVEEEALPPEAEAPAEL